MDNSGISAQRTDGDGRSWTMCPCLRVRRLGVRVSPSTPLSSPGEHLREITSRVVRPVTCPLPLSTGSDRLRELPWLLLGEVAHCGVVRFLGPVGEVIAGDEGLWVLWPRTRSRAGSSAVSMSRARPRFAGPPGEGGEVVPAVEGRWVLWALTHFGAGTTDLCGPPIMLALRSTRAIRCALAIRDAVRGIGLEVRQGLHTGECEVLDGKVAGIAVAIGARVSARARPTKY
jgi:class 3 adenylate cyclase